MLELPGVKALPHLMSRPERIVSAGLAVLALPAAVGWIAARATPTNSLELRRAIG